MAAPVPPTQAPTSAGPSRIPFLTDAVRLARVLYEPGKVFEEQREKPTWFLPWLVIAVVCLVVGFWDLPYSQRAMELAIQAYPNAPQLTDAQLHSRAMIGLPFIPIVFLILALINAGILFVVVSVAGGKARYTGLLSVSAFAEVMFPIALLLQSVILRLRGAPADAISTVMDAQPALGLNVLLSSNSHFLQAIYAGIGPLPIWSLIITAIGLMRLEGVKKNTAWTAAVTCFVVMLLVGGLLAGLQRG